MHVTFMGLCFIQSTIVYSLPAHPQVLLVDIFSFYFILVVSNRTFLEKKLVDIWRHISCPKLYVLCIPCLKLYVLYCFLSILNIMYDCMYMHTHAF